MVSNSFSGSSAHWAFWGLRMYRPPATATCSVARPCSVIDTFRCTPDSEVCPTIARARVVSFASSRSISGGRVVPKSAFTQPGW